jgi:hypothetical protein
MFCEPDCSPVAIVSEKQSRSFLKFLRKFIAGFGAIDSLKSQIAKTRHCVGILHRSASDPGVARTDWDKHFPDTVVATER